MLTTDIIFWGIISFLLACAIYIGVVGLILPYQTTRKEK